MKKVLLFVLGMAMILSMVGGVAGVLTPSHQEQTATVSLTVNTDYQITIPSEFLIDSTTRMGDGQISVVMKSVPASKNLTVNVTSPNYGHDQTHTNAWALYHESGDASEYSAYIMNVSDDYNDHLSSDMITSPIGNHGKIIDIPANQNEGGVPMTKYLHFRLIGDTTYSGAYTDTLTFCVSLTDTDGNP